MAVHRLLAHRGLDQRLVLVGSGEHAGVRVLLHARLRHHPCDGDHLLDQEGLGDRQEDLEGRPGEKSATESQEASEIPCCSLAPPSGENIPPLRITPLSSEVCQPADERRAGRLHF